MYIHFRIIFTSLWGHFGDTLGVILRSFPPGAAVACHLFVMESDLRLWRGAGICKPGGKLPSFGRRVPAVRAVSSRRSGGELPPFVR